MKPSRFRPRTRLVAALTGALVLGAGGAALASHAFSDVPDSHPFHDEIGWMAERGISTGYPDGTYRPGLPVTRQAMSAFMFRSAEATTPIVLTDTEFVSAPSAAACVLGPYTPDFEQQATFNGGVYHLSDGTSWVGARVQYRANGGSWSDVTGAFEVPSSAPSGGYANGTLAGAVALEPGVQYEFSIRTRGSGWASPGDGGCQLVATIHHRMPGQSVGGTSAAAAASIPESAPPPGSPNAG